MEHIAEGTEIGTMATATPSKGFEERHLPDESDLFPEFQAALRMDEVAARGLKHSTRYRYLRGELPASFEWFLEHPEFLRLLANDAEAMSEEKWERFRDAIGSRASAQKDRRRDADK